MANENKKANFFKIITFLDLSKIPGPRLFKYFKLVKLFQKDILKGFTKTHEIYGDIASFPWPMNSVIIYSPKFYKQVLIDDSKKYSKGEQSDELKAVLGNGLATNSNYQSWLRNRSIISKEFTRKSVNEYVDVIEKISSKYIQKADEKVEMSILIKMLTLEISSSIFLGINLNEEQMANITEAVEFTSAVTYERIFQFFPLPYWVPLKKHRKFKKLFNYLNKIVNEAIEEEKQAQEIKTNILSRLVHAVDPQTNQKLTHSEIRDEVLTFLIGGYETTAYSITWILSLLAKHQNVQDKLYSEIKNYNGNSILDDNIYLNLIISESMRLYPVFPVLSRKAIVDTQIGEYKIPKHTNVVLPIYVTQRSEKYLQNPKEFNPDRFLDDSLVKNHISNPFSKGPRRCIGETMAMMEIAVVLKNMLLTYKVLLDSNFPVETAHVTLKPDAPLWMRLEKR